MKVNFKIRGVSYFGVRTPNHVLHDMKSIKELGYNAILHTFSEEDLQYYSSTMKKIIQETKALGFYIYVNPWGVGRVFGGEAYSEITAKNHDICQIALDGKPKVAACPNHPKFQDYMYHWIEFVCNTQADVIFWDEPHFYFEKGNLENWSCRCSTCQKLFKKKYGYEMPCELTHDVKNFREDSLIQFLKKMTEKVHQFGKKNCICLLPPWFPAGLDNWDKIAQLKSVDELASDPYWERGDSEKTVREKYEQTAQKLVTTAEKYDKSMQMWIKAYQIEEGRENDLVIAIEETQKAHIDNIFAWSYRGTEFLSALASDNPDKVTKIYRKAIGL